MIIMKNERIISLGEGCRGTKWLFLIAMTVKFLVSWECLLLQWNRVSLKGSFRKEGKVGNWIKRSRMGQV